MIKEAISVGDDSCLEEVRKLIDKSDYNSELSEIFSLMKDLNDLAEGSDITKIYYRVIGLSNKKVKDDILEANEHMRFINGLDGEYEAGLPNSNHELISVRVNIVEGHIIIESSVDFVESSDGFMVSSEEYGNSNTQFFESDVFCAPKGYKIIDSIHNSELSLEQGGKSGIWIDGRLYKKM